jgi:hypothetical protein
MTDFIIDHTPSEGIDISTIVLEPTREELSLRINTLEREVERLNFNFTNANQRANDAEQKIENVRGLIQDYVSAGDRIEDQTKEICDLLDIELTKTISGTAIYEISWSATVPLDFDADSMEISFEVECESYEAEDFDWNEDNCEVNGSDD